MAIPSQYPIYKKKYILYLLVKRVLILVIKESAVSPCLQQDHSHLGVIWRKKISLEGRVVGLSWKVSWFSQKGNTSLCPYVAAICSGVDFWTKNILKTESKVFLCQPAYLDSSSLPPAASPRTQLPFKIRSNFYRWQRHDMLMIETLRWPLIAAWWSGCSE